MSGNAGVETNCSLGHGHPGCFKAVAFALDGASKREVLGSQL